ncbi:MAG: tetratricopeptide repeat protein [Nitrospirae bacterium]|nr:tetratricopeptide repeat protein [Nitrospirota bacterium]
MKRKGYSHAGEIIFTAGRVIIKLFPEENFQPALTGQKLIPGDIIKTGNLSRASILFKDSTQLKLGSNTTLIIKEVTTHKEKTGAMKILLSLESGEIWTRSKGLKDGLIIETPYATAAIRGTEWSLSVKDNESRLVVLEGNIQLFNPFGSIIVSRNEQAVVFARQAPIKTFIVRPRDRIQWTYYLSERRLLKYLKFKEGFLGSAEKLFNEGRFEESTDEFEDILSREPENSSALTGLGLNELIKGNIEKANEYFERALKRRKDLLSLLGKSYVLITKNLSDEARDVLNEAKTLFPKDGLPYIFSSYLHIFLGDFIGAIYECEAGLSVVPNDLSILAFETDIYFILNKVDYAKAIIDRIIKENPFSSEGYEKLGLYHRFVTGDSEEAKKAFLRAISLNRFNDETIAELSDLLREEGYIPEALELIREALSVAPFNASHHYNYGRLLSDINRLIKAGLEFRKSHELDPTFSRAYLGEGIMLLKEGKIDEALTELSKASLFEPDLSEVHSFLAIAYYQKHAFSEALEELKRAGECDPLDSTPHQLASIIYNDLYMPANAIEEAQKVIELLPYRKASGEALFERAQTGMMSVNYGLNFFDLPEWSLYYSQKAIFINPYSNISHIGVAKAYEKLGLVSFLQGYNEFETPYFSEILQGLILNVNSLNFSNRYNTLISKPGHYLTLESRYSAGDSEEIQSYLEGSGDLGSHFPLTYWFYSKAFRDNGYLQNSKTRSLDSEIILGYKPNYKDDFYLNLGYYKDKIGITPSASISFRRYDDNQKYRDNGYWIDLGYHRRFNPVSHLIANLRYFKENDNIENPDFKNDLSRFADSADKLQNIAFGIRHMFTLLDYHQISYGIDYNFEKVNFGEEWTYLYPRWVERIHQTHISRYFIFHIYDRWSVTSKIILDTGLYLSYYSTKADYKSDDTLVGSFNSRIYDDNTFDLNPRIGITVNIGDNGIFRFAYQKRSTTGFLGELAPVGVSGLIPPTFDMDFSSAEDIQWSLEYELTKKMFIKTLIGYSKLSDIVAPYHNKKAQLWYSRIALNQILNRYFSFSARYHYNDSMYLDGSKRKLFGVPLNSGDVRLVFIHPKEIYLSIRESYIGERYADSDNTIKLRGYFTTDFYAQKELLKKRIFLSLAINNIFNTKYETLSHPYYWYEGALPAKGTTFSFRIGYRL